MRSWRWLSGAAAAVLVTAACSVPDGPTIPRPLGGPASSVAVPPEAADQPTPAGDPARPDFPTAHPLFTAHFTDPLYSDEANEFAPFGSDEGADTLAWWDERRTELDRCTTLRWMVEQDDVAGALEDPSGNGPDVDGFVIGAGFALILITGHIDSEGKQLTLDALQRTYSFYADSEPREQAVMLRDLQSFPATDCSKP